MSNVAKELPPQNINAEQGVIASVLMDGESMHEVAMILREADFFRAAHAKIWSALMAIYEAGKPIDIIAVSDELVRRGEFDAIGGHEAFDAILESVAHSYNAKFYAEIVRQVAIARDLIEAGNETNRDSYSRQYDSDELLIRAEMRIFAIAARQAMPQAIKGPELAKISLEQLRERMGDVPDGLVTGFDDLDAVLGSMLAGGITVVAARPSQGKTAFALNVCENVAIHRDTPTLFISLEMTARELGDRLLSSLSGVPGGKLKNPRFLSPTDWQAINAAAEKIERSNLIIDETPTLNISKIGAMARYHKARSGIDLLAIDYLSLIKANSERGKNRQEEVAEMSRALKGLARELKIPLLLLCQLNRESEKGERRRPRLADLRETGQIEQDAHQVILLHRLEPPGDRPRIGSTEVIVEKNRNGATGVVTMGFHGELTKFVARAPEHHIQEEQREW